MIIRLKNTKYAFLNLILAIIIGIIFQFKDSDFQVWLTWFFVITIICLAKDTMLLLTSGYRLFSFAYIFIVCSYLFHFGRVLNNVVFPNGKHIDSDYLAFYSYDITENSLIFCLVIIELVVTGLLLFQKDEQTYTHQTFLSSNISVAHFKIAAWIITVIAVPLKYKQVTSQIALLRITGDYGQALGTNSGNYSGVYSQFANFVILGFAMLLLAYSYDRLKASIIFAGEAMFLVWMMLSGGKIYTVVSLIILLYIYHNKIHKISWKNFLLVIIVALVFMQLLGAITAARSKGAFDTSNIFQYMFSPQNNTIYRFLDEFGGTILTVIKAVDEIPQRIDFHFGLSYIQSFALIGLNINDSLTKIQLQIEYPRLFFRQYALGGTYIGELYYNFGYFSYMLAPLVGAFVGRISSAAEDCIERDDYIRFSYYIMPIYALLTWVRGYFSGFTRGTVWGAILIFVMTKL